MKKERLIFAYRWNKIPEKSWSGSAYAVFKELEKRYDVERFDLSDSLDVKFFKLFRKLRFVSGETSIIRLINKNNRIFTKKYGDSQEKVFQFCEAPCTANTKNYIYQDLSIDILHHMKEEDPFAFGFSGYEGLSEKQFQQRIQMQAEFYRSCAGIFTMGKWVADYLIQECKIPQEKVHVVGAGLNVPVEKPDYSQKQGNKILFVGKIFKQKGGEIVVEAFKILRREYMKDAELYIVGPPENPLNEEIPGVHFVGSLSREKVPEYYNKCDIFCMPSYFEMYGIAFCEALAYGLPCIARNKFAMPENIEDGKDGYLIDEDDALDLAKKMYDLLNNKEITKTVRERYDSYIEKHSWSRIVDEMQRIMDR